MLSEEIIARLSFDSSDFIKNTDKSIKQLDKLEKNLEFDKGKKNLDNISKAFTLTDMVIFSAVNSIVSTVTKKLMRTLNSVSFKPIFTGFQEFETQINSIQVILANVAKDGIGEEEISKKLDILNKYADDTIYNFTQMTDAIGTFTAIGVDLDTSVDAIKGIANAAAFFGSTAQQAQSAYTAFSRAIKNDRLGSREYMTLKTAGIAGERLEYIMSAVGDNMGKGFNRYYESGLKFQDIVEAGLVSADVMLETLKIFSNEIPEEFASMEDYLVSQGFSAHMAEELAAIAKQAEKSATEIRTYTLLMDTLGEQLQTGWADSWSIVFGGLEDNIEFWSGIEGVVGGWIQMMNNARNSMLESLKESGAFEKLFNSLHTILAAFDRIFKQVGVSWRKVFPKRSVNILSVIIDAIVSMVDKFAEFTQDTERLDRFLVGVFSVFKQLGAVLKVVWTIAKSILSVLGSILWAIISITLHIVENLQPIANKIADVLHKVSDAILKFRDFVVKIIKDIAKMFGGSNVVEDEVNIVIDAIDELEKASEKFYNSKFVQTLINFGTFFKKAFSQIGEAIYEFSKSLANMEFGPIENGFDWLLENLPEILDLMMGFKTLDFVDALTGYIRGLTQPLAEAQSVLKPGHILAIAGAVLILAISIGYLSSLGEDEEKIDRAILVIKSLLTMMTAAVATISLLNIGLAGLAAAAVMQAFAFALLILIGGVVLIASFSDQVKIFLAMTVVLLLLAGLTTMMVVVTKFSKDAIKITKDSSFTAVISGLFAQALFLHVLATTMAFFVAGLLAIAIVMSTLDKDGKGGFLILLKSVGLILMLGAIIVAIAWAVEFINDEIEADLTYMTDKGDKYFNLHVKMDAFLAMTTFLLTMGVMMMVLVAAVVLLSKFVKKDTAPMVFGIISGLVLLLGGITFGFLAISKAVIRLTTEIEDGKIKDIGFKFSIPFALGLSSMLLSFGAAVAVLVGALIGLMYVVDMVYPDALLYASIMFVSVLALTILGVSLIVNAVRVRFKLIKDTEKSMMKSKVSFSALFGISGILFVLALSVSMLIFAIMGTAKLLEKTPIEQVFNAMILLGIVSTLIAAILLGLSLFFRPLLDVDMTEDTKETKTFVKTLKTFSLVIFQMMVPFAGLMAAIGAMYLLLPAVFAVMEIVKRLDVGFKDVFKGVGILLSIGVVLFIIAAAMRLLIEKVTVTAKLGRKNNKDFSELTGELENNNKKTKASLKIMSTNLMSIGATMLALAVTISVIAFILMFVLEKMQEINLSELNKNNQLIIILGIVFGVVFLSLLSILIFTKKMSLHVDKLNEEYADGAKRTKRGFGIQGSTMFGIQSTLIAFGIFIVAIAAAIYIVVLTIDDLSNRVDQVRTIIDDSRVLSKDNPIFIALAILAGLLITIMIASGLLSMITRKSSTKLTADTKIMITIIGPIAGAMLAFSMIMFMATLLIKQLIKTYERGIDLGVMATAFIAISMTLVVILLSVALGMYYINQAEKKIKKEDKDEKKLLKKVVSIFKVIVAFVSILGIMTMLIKFGNIMAGSGEANLAVVAQFGIAVAVIVGVLTALKLLDKIEPEKIRKNIKPMFALIGTSILVLMAIISFVVILNKVLGTNTVDMALLGKSILVIIVVAVAVIITMEIFYRVVRQINVKESDHKRILKTFSVLVMTLIILSVGVFLVQKIISKIPLNVIPMLLGLVAILAALSILGILLGRMNKFMKGKDIRNFAITFTILIATLVIISLSILIINKILGSLSIGKLIPQLLLVVGVLLVLGLITKILNTLGLGPMVAITLMMIGMSLLFIAVAFKTLGEVKIKPVILALLVLTAFLLVLGLLGFVIGPTLIAMGVGLMFIGGAVLFLGMGIWLLIDAFRMLSEMSGPAVDQALENILKILKGLRPVVFELAALLTTLLVAAITELANRVDSIIKTILDIIYAVLNAIIDNLPTILDKIWQIIFQIIDSFIENVPKLMDKFAEFLNAIAEKIPDTFKSVSNLWGTALANGVLAIIDAGTTFWKTLKDGLAERFPKAAGVLGGVIDGVKGLFHSEGGDILAHSSTSLTSENSGQVEFMFRPVSHSNKIETELLTAMAGFNRSNFSKADIPSTRIAERASIYIYNGTVYNYNSDVNITLNNTFESVDGKGMTPQEISVELGKLLELETKKWR